MTILNIEISNIDNLFNVTTYTNTGLETETDVKAFTSLDDAQQYAKQVLDQDI